MKSLFILFIFCCYNGLVFAQPAEDPAGILPDIHADSISKTAAVNIQPERHPALLKSFIFPSVLVTYGFVALGSHGLHNLDNTIKEEIWTEHPHHTIGIDNYLQYTPGVMVYGLQAMGVKGKNNIIDESFIYLMANGIMGATVGTLKHMTKSRRPDGFGSNAFPSGHTATAFVSAEFLAHEYGGLSPWYGIAGYSMAVATAYLRMYNNRHWFRDLAPGAGIGMISTRLAYWIYPKIKNWLFKGKELNSMILPTYTNGVAGISMVHVFK